MSAAKPTKLNRTAGILLCLLTLAMGLRAATVQAAQIVWGSKTYSHYAQKENVKSVLTDFFAAQGIGVICSEEVKGTISGNFSKQNAEKFFKHITDAYNLIWYYDGAAVYLYSAHELTSRILNLGYLDMKTFRQNLVDLDLYDPRFALRIIEKDRIVYLSGPQRYVDLITEMAEQLDAKSLAQRGRDDVVRIFPLKHAWADDKTIVFRDKRMIIPGVATLLGNLLSGTTVPGQVGMRNQVQVSAPLAKLKGRGVARHRQVETDPGAEQGDYEALPPVEEAGMQETEPSHHPAAYKENDTGVIQADMRQNAVVVRDREEKMPYYQEVINMLDAPVNLVEIRATIMDIDRADLQELGIQWEFASTDDDAERVVKGGLNTNGLFAQEQGLQLPIGDGLNIATILGDAADFFLAKVHALQEKGDARILSRPSVLTLNNIEAQLEHSQTFYVRLTGEREVDLFDINAGVVLRVTPHIIEEEDQTLVKLAIQIEDGELTGDQVDDIPVVKRSIINTQAVVGQEESLLIGGYMQERNISRRQQAPCLGDVPLFGWLFKKRSTINDESERLFLITPTIVPYGSRNTVVGRGGKHTAPKTHNQERTQAKSEVKAGPGNSQIITAPQDEPDQP